MIQKIDGKFRRFDVVHSLVGGGISNLFNADGTESFTYYDGQTPVTDAEIDAEIIRLEAEYDAQEYSRNRATAFPSIGYQLDMQYHDQLDGTTTWKDAVAKVKADNPKD